VPWLLLLAFTAAMAESGGKESNLPLAVLLVALVCAAVIGAGVALKKIYSGTAWQRWGLVSLVTILGFPLFAIVLRIFGSHF
jgi:hypothetical protein